MRGTAPVLLYRITTAKYIIHNIFPYYFIRLIPLKYLSYACFFQASDFLILRRSY